MDEWWDRQQDRPVCHCEACGGEIYAGETYYIFRDQTLCDTCVQPMVAGEDDV
ncbi:MAG: hypothetical protein LUG65_03935 [Clostridiales bacterium]|nr:hypothetical protein [Clostridiales bacterium]